MKSFRLLIVMTERMPKQESFRCLDALGAQPTET
ncbi:hypothetical protein N184_19730 [Sinorhizobium sp. GL28]|nr:hypothetical protein N183_07760 [Sinorhizobium sp. Sb3]KSV93933.1 hypothetical protein N184_19730 [Sinorhizobium sp. GL28]